MAIGAGYVSKLVASLLEGGGIDNILSKKLETLGEDFIRSQLSLGGAFGSADKFLSGFDSQAQFDKLRTNWLNQVKGKPLPYQGFVSKLFNVLDEAVGGKGAGKGAGRNAKWSRSSWARSRNDWLDNHWKHDWRSQPRDPISGRWLPGRLATIDPALRSRGVKTGRITKRRRKLRRQARMRGRNAAKKLFRR
jgi:hypothetical protein